MSETNSNPGWYQGQIPSPTEWNQSFTEKIDAVGGFATNLQSSGGIFATPAINGGPCSPDTLTVRGTATFGGTVTLAADPVSGLDAATRQYVDNATAGQFGDFYVMTYGAFFDDVHDDTQAILAAQAAAEAAGGGKVVFPSGKVGLLSRTIVNDTSNVHFISDGIGPSFLVTQPIANGATKLKWIGPVGGTMMIIGPTQTSPPSGVPTWNQNTTLILDCQGTAAFGLVIQSVRESRFNVLVLEANHTGVLFTTVWLAPAPTSAQTPEINDSQNNFIEALDCSINRYGVTTTVSTTLSAPAATVAVASGTAAGFVAGMRVQVGSNPYVIAPGGVAAAALTFTTPVSVADATAARTVAFAPIGVHYHGLTPDLIPTGYYPQGATSWPQLAVGNVSGNQGVRTGGIVYTPAGAGIVFGYADNNDFIAAGTQTVGGSGVYGLVFDGSNLSGCASGQNLVIQATGIAVSRGTPSGYAYGGSGRILAYPSANMGAQPLQEAGSTLLAYDTAGYYYDLTINGALTIAGNQGHNTITESDLRITHGSGGILLSLAAQPANPVSIGFPTFDLSQARWTFGTDGIAEGTGNTGNAMRFQSFDNAGNYLGTPMTIARTGAVLFDGVVTLGGDAVGQLDAVTLRQMQGTAGNYLPITGGNLQGNLTIASASPTLTLNNPGGQPTAIYALINGLNRWNLSFAVGAESTGNAGSDMTLYRYADNGSFLGASISVSRQTAALNQPGDLTISGLSYQPGGGPWGTASDARIKTVQGSYDQGLEAILALNPVRYSLRGNWTTQPPEQAQGLSGVSPHAQAAADGIEFIGLVAQDTEGVMPEMVDTIAAYIDGAHVDDLRTMNTNALNYALVNAIKTLHARVAALEASAGS
jgi:hypothetical protein